MMVRYLRGILAALAILAAPAPAMAQTVTTGAPTGLTIQTNGAGSAAGQSFLSPGGVLNSFTAYFSGNPGGSEATFFIAPLSGNSLGTAIFEQRITLGGSVGMYRFDDLNLAVSNQRYAAVLHNNLGAQSIVIYRSDNPDNSDRYADGSWLSVSMTNGTAVEISAFGDAAFTAVFNAPEPGAWALMIGGFGVCGVGIRRRRAAQLAAA